MIDLNNVSKIYNLGKSNECKAVKNVDLHIDDGELLAIIGKSGAGKSTLLHILGCIDSCTSGEYFIDGVSAANLSEKEYAQVRNEKIGMIMQDFALVEEISAIENVMLPLLFSKRKPKDKKALAMKALKSVDIAELADKRVNELSGGQKQRVAIARAIVNQPSIILADEPTGALDSKTSAEIMELFLELNKQGKTIIIITHDMNIAEQCKRVVRISDGCIR